MDTTEDYLTVCCREDSCPNWPTPDSHTLVSSIYEPVINSTKYSIEYQMQYTSYQNGSEWFMYIEPLIECPSNVTVCSTLSYSLLITQEFICEPPCQNGGSCSPNLPNTCECTYAGYSGDRCEFREYNRCNDNYFILKFNWFVFYSIM